jgi:ribosome biogenesis protein MAK21
VFASNVLVKQKGLPKPELANHTLMHFLDKFVYRNPKSTDNKHGSIMQPVHAAGTSAQVVVPGKTMAAQQPVLNSASFWNLKLNQVAADDVFFHEYYTQAGKPGLAAKAKKADEKKKKAKKDADGDSDEEEAAEDEIWEALVNSRPEIEGGDDSESDLDMEDYDDSDDDMDLDGGAEDSDMASEGSGGFEGIFGDSDEDAGDADSDDQGDDVAADAEEEGRKGRYKDSREHKKKMKGLPTFASAEDYAAMLEAEENDLDTGY